MSLRLGALSEPLTSCIRAFNRAARAAGLSCGRHRRDPGSGPIGVLAVAAALEMGAGQVICVGAPETPRLRSSARRLARRPPSTLRKSRRRRRASNAVRDIVGGFGADLVIWDCSGHPRRGPRGHRDAADGGTSMSRSASSPMPAQSIPPGTRICTKDLNVLGSWGFTGNDLPLGVDMLYRTRNNTRHM